MSRQLPTSAPELPRERCYQLEVLQLPDGCNEDDLDAQCTSEARELGIEPYSMAILQELASNFAGLTVSNAPRRSASIGSRGSHSTGLTSDVSRSSKEQQYSRNGSRLRPMRTRTNSKTSLSLKDYDAVVRHIKPESPSSPSTPAMTPPQSSISLPLASPRRHFSRMRTLSQWPKLKRQSRAPSAAEISAQNHPIHVLPCQHAYCTPTLRKIIRDSMADESRLPPNCCDTPIPGGLVEKVLTGEELQDFLNNMSTWDDSMSFSSLSEPPDSTSSENGRAPWRKHGRTFSNESAPYFQDAEATRNLERANEMPDFRELRQRHERERDRFLTFLSKQRQTTALRHEDRRSEMLAQQKEAEDGLEQKQIETVAAVEEKHVSDELDLVATQEAETRACDLALRHMEAYCYPSSSTSSHPTTPRPPSANLTFFNDGSSSQTSLPSPSPTSPSSSASLSRHPVTEQDLKELGKQYWLRDHLPAKHTAAINVLRGDQAQRLRRRHRNNDAARDQLAATHQQQLRDFDNAYAAELADLERWARGKRRRMTARWELREASWRVKVCEARDNSAAEIAGPVAIRGPIRGVRWPDEDEGVEVIDRVPSRSRPPMERTGSRIELAQQQRVKESRRDLPSPALSSLSEKGTKIYLVP
ncbi:MAG: hypothetical protein M1822_000964 [Bathelium mastoideum]|nr:MAG: hypothetical protein M1822_000964 [Bathelium mastoideum]